MVIGNDSLKYGAFKNVGYVQQEAERPDLESI
jgi:hypothetical protein